MLNVLQQLPFKDAQLNQASWITNYLKTLTWNRFTASAFKRVSVTSAEYVLIRVLVPGAFASSLRYLATSTTGTVSKNLAYYYMNARSQSDQGSILVPILKSDLKKVESDLKKQDPNWTCTFTSYANQAIDKTKNAVINGCFGVLDVTYEDLSEGIGGTVGSTLASGAFIAYMGPPSLFILPLYFLTEGFCKSVGSFLGKHWGRRMLGPAVVKPAIQNAWQALHQASSQELESTYESLVLELEKLNLAETLDIEESPTQDKLLNSWYLMKEAPPEPEPKARFIKGQTFEILEEYQEPATNKPFNS